MYRFAEKNIDSLINNSHVGIVKLNDFQFIFDEIYKSFNINEKGVHNEMWIQLMKKNPDFSIQDKDGWLLSIKHIDSYPCYLIIDDSSDRVVYKIFNKEDLKYLLSETIGFVYYLCSEKFDRILFFNSYDLLAVFNKK